MIRLRSFLSEELLDEAAAAGKNLHLEHIEDEILNFGVKGGRASINFLQELRNMLAGNSTKKVNVTVKWDGAPAIFAGTDPEDGKFFVGTKGVFAKNPKTVKTMADLDTYGYSGGLRDKLILALKEMPKLGINGVLQGDMMFSSDDLETKTIDGQEYITFQPNTIVYAIPTGSDLAKTIQKAKMGIIFHTTYEGGPTLADMTASFGANVSGLRSTPSVWFDNADYQDVSGKVLFTDKETTELTRYLSRAGTVFQKIDSRSLDNFIRAQSQLASAAGSSFKTYNNSFIRAGKAIKDPRKHAMDYLRYFEDWWQTKMIAKVKTEAAKEAKRQKMKEHMRIIQKNLKTIQQITEFQIHLVDAKSMIVKKLNSGAGAMKTFVQTPTGFKVVGDEGYVAVDRLGKNAVKLVDRLEFSYNNFTAQKNWSK